MPVWDLPVDPELTQPLIAQLYGQLTDAFANLKALVGDMTQEELEYRGPDGNLNSTATLIRHLAMTDQLFLYRFRGEELPEEFVAAFYMPDHSLPVITGRSQKELLTECTAVREQIKAFLKTRTDADLCQELYMNPRRNVTPRQALWHMAEHSMLHQGHIRWLKTWYRR